MINTKSSETVDEELPHVGATITDVQAKSIAEEFYKALVTEGLKDSMELLKPIFPKMKNSADFNKVYNAFGKRQYSDTWGNQGDPLTSENKDLIHILKNEPDVDWNWINEYYSHLGIL